MERAVAIAVAWFDIIVCSFLPWCFIIFCCIALIWLVLVICRVGYIVKRRFR